MLESLTSAGVEQSDVDETISHGFRSLRFPDKLEAAFENADSRRRSLKLTIGGLLGVLAYDSFLLTDWLLSPETFATALWIRLGLVTPIQFCAIAALFFEPAVVWRELIIVVFGALLPTASHLYLIHGGDVLVQGSQHQAIVLVIMFVTMVQRIRFRYAILACFMSFALYVAALARIPGYAVELQLQADIVFFSAVVFSLFVSYSLEREYRLNYLFSLRSLFHNRALDAISRLDALTSLYNRRALNETLDQARDTLGTADAMSIILIDIDHFKAFNDAAGHLGGDRCLRVIADILRGRCGAGHSAFRYGGEEFLILSRGTSLSEAQAIAETLRQAIEIARIPHPGLSGDAFVTASFGVASATPSSSLRPEEIVEAADAALYLAKQNGRNQVCPGSSTASAASYVQAVSPRDQTATIRGGRV